MVPNGLCNDTLQVMSRKILHLIGAMIAGGAERFVADIAIAQKSLGDDIEIFALSSRTDRAGMAIRAALDANQIRYHTGSDGRVGPLAVLGYARRCRSFQPDIVHLHTPNTELAHALANLFSRCTQTLARTIHNTNLPDSRISEWAFRRNPVARSIACSDAVASAAERRGIRLTVIPNGVNFHWPIRTEAESTRARKALGLTGDATHFVAIGSMDGQTLADAQKAHDCLIRSWQLSGAAANNAELHLLGDGNLKERLEHLAESDRSIKFHGIQENPETWLLAADAFVMPSRYEGLPIAGIEAIGTGLLCLFSDIQSLRNLDPPAVFWSAVDNEKELADNLRSALSSPPQASEHDIELVRKRFSILQTARKYSSYYDDLLDR